MNHEVLALGPRMNRLTSTGVYFTEPTLVPDLPTLPGQVLEAVECEEPLMVGEFVDGDGTPWAMVVNLSLERSAKITPLRGGAPVEGVFCSPHDGRERPINYEDGLWLVAGQGLLLRP